MTVDIEKIEELFVETAKCNGTYEDMKDKIRSFHSCDVITDEEYDYILSEWDNMLNKYSNEIM